MTILGALSILPIWNAALMQRDVLLVYFVGYGIQKAIISICACSIASYLVIMAVFFRLSQKSVQTDQTMLVVAICFASAMGSALTIVSFPVRQTATHVRTMLSDNCPYNEKTHDLYTTYEILLALRERPWCSYEISVEQCAGFMDASG